MTDTAKRQRDWWRICWRALMAVSAAAAIVASYTYLRDLAQACGWTDWRASLLPISLDVLGIAAFALYIRTRDGYAQAVSVLVVVASAAGNALSHLYGVTNTPPASEVVLAVGSAPVVAAIVLAHLWAHERKDTHDTRRTGDGAVPATGEAARLAGGIGADPGRIGTRNLEPAAVGSRTRAATGDGPSRGNGASRPAPRRRGDGTRRGSANGPSIPELAALIRSEGITSKRQLKALAHVGDPKVRAAFDLVTPNANGSRQ